MIAPEDIYILDVAELTRDLYRLGYIGALEEQGMDRSRVEQVIMGI